MSDARQPLDAAQGTFSSDPPWLMTADPLPWQRDLDAVRASTRGTVPALTRSPRFPPVGRLAVTLRHLGGAIAGWWLTERRSTDRSDRRRGLSVRLRQAIEELGAAVAASTSNTASRVTELRHALSAGLRSGPMSAAQEQLDGSVRAQLEKLSTLRSGLEAAIAADLTGTGADGVEDDIVQALRGSSERLDADAGSLLACIAQQEQQRGELAMRLESLDAARQGLHGSTVASVMQGMAAVQEEKARDVAAAVTAGVETLLKTELGKMRAACEEKAGELVQQHLKQMAGYRCPSGAPHPCSEL